MCFLASFFLGFSKQYFVSYKKYLSLNFGICGALERILAEIYESTNEWSQHDTAIKNCQVHQWVLKSRLVWFIYLYPGKINSNCKYLAPLY